MIHIALKYTIQCFGIPYCIIHCKPFWCFVLYHTLYTCLVFLLYHTLQTVLVFHIVSYSVHLFDVPIVPYTLHRFGVPYFTLHCTYSVYLHYDKIIEKRWNKQLVNDNEQLDVQKDEQNLRNSAKHGIKVVLNSHYRSDHNLIELIFLKIKSLL